MRLPRLALLVLASLAACGDSSGSSSEGDASSETSEPTVPIEGPEDDAQAVEVEVPQTPRSYQMGIRAFYYDRSIAAQDRTWTFIDDHADAVAIVLDSGIPWQELIDGDDFPAGFESELVEWEERLLGRDLDVYIAVDAFAPDRLGLAPDSEGRQVPQAVAGASAGDPTVAQALVAYSERLVQRFEPAFFSPMIDINVYLLNRPSDYESAVLTYKEAREAAKRVRFETQVFPTWNLELLAGLGPNSEDDQYAQMRMLDANSDRLGLSITPATFLMTPESLADDHIRQVEQWTSREIVIANTGYPSVGFQAGPIILPSSENTQHNFLANVLSVAEDGRYDLVVWSYPYDFPAVLESLCPGRIENSNEACSRSDEFDALRPYVSAGLATAGVAAKKALSLWDDWYARQYLP